ncbi:MAG: hypothetical protein C0606_11945 [Hyphomicrobiales bacterium]|nr:MAG: hypothetical protein C0606_11945 [Hyphomicrobiales bacterium]
MHHKKRRTPSQRGPKYNKPWKRVGVRTQSAEGERFSDHRRRAFADEDIANAMQGGNATNDSRES